MKFLEKDLEQIIYEANKELLTEKGLSISGKLIRQVRIGNYGVADLIEFKRPFFHTGLNDLCKGEIIIYELKQDKIGISAFLQALGYLKGIRTYFDIKGIGDNYNYSIKLIGKDIDLKSTYVYLVDFLNFDLEININSESKFTLENYIYEYDFNGISFKQLSGYNLTNKGF